MSEYKYSFINIYFFCVRGGVNGGLNHYKLLQKRYFSQSFVPFNKTNWSCISLESSHNSLTPPPWVGHQADHILSLDGILFLNQELLKVNPRGCAGHSSTHSTPKPIPQVFSWGLDSRQVITSSLLPNSGGTLWSWLCVECCPLEDGVRSQVLKIFHCGAGRYGLKSIPRYIKKMCDNDISDNIKRLKTL